METAFLIIFGTLVAANGVLAIRSRSEAAMWMAGLISFDFISSQIIGLLVREPLLPFLFSLIALVVINRFLAKLYLYRTGFQRYTLPSIYGLMIFLNLTYLVTGGTWATAYYVIMDVLFLAVVFTNMKMSQGSGSVMDDLYHRNGTGIWRGHSAHRHDR